MNLVSMSFQSIYSFVSDLNQAFGELSRPLKLYSNFLDKITCDDNTTKSKTIELFRQFCVNNRDAIIARDTVLLSPKQIKYSDKAYIDFEFFFAVASDEQREIIWRHLLTISALTDPESQAKKILCAPSKGSNQPDILSKVISKIEQNIDINEAMNPMDAVNKMVQSGVLTELVSDLAQSINNGDVDLSSLMSRIQM